MDGASFRSRCVCADLPTKTLTVTKLCRSSHAPLSLRSATESARPPLTTAIALPPARSAWRRRLHRGCATGYTVVNTGDQTAFHLRVAAFHLAAPESAWTTSSPGLASIVSLPPVNEVAVRRVIAWPRIISCRSPSPLARRGKPGKFATVAVALELAGLLWAAATVA
jgi:hypothetical protein